MKDKPILFSAPMVRALLDGRKTQTRRVLKIDAPQEATSAGHYTNSIEGDVGKWSWLSGDPKDVDTWEFLDDFLAPYCIGDRLYVKEAWRTWKDIDHLPPIETLIHDAPIFYELDRDNCDRHGRYRSARFMMRHMSRLTLNVTDVRVQRLQDISEADAIAEGLEWTTPGMWSVAHNLPIIGHCPIKVYSELWNNINDPDAWAANPWVVALTFDVHRCNIDTTP